MATQQDVDDIKAALQRARTGKMVASVSSSGRSVSYQTMSVAELEAALAKAESELVGRPKRGAIAIRFCG